MAKKTIILKGDPVIKEYTLSGNITPGMLGMIDTDGKAKVHATANGTAAAMFALEDELQGNDIDTAYSSGAIGRFALCRPGDEVYAIMGSLDSIDEGQYLVSNGDGCLQIAPTIDSASDLVQAGSIVARALEALTFTSGAAATARRVKVEIV